MRRASRVVAIVVGVSCAGIFACSKFTSTASTGSTATDSGTADSTVISSGDGCPVLLALSPGDFRCASYPGCKRLIFCQDFDDFGGESTLNAGTGSAQISVDGGPIFSSGPPDAESPPDVLLIGSATPPSSVVISASAPSPTWGIAVDLFLNDADFVFELNVLNLTVGSTEFAVSTKGGTTSSELIFSTTTPGGTAQTLSVEPGEWIHLVFERDSDGHVVVQPNDADLTLGATDSPAIVLELTAAVTPVVPSAIVAFDNVIALTPPAQ